MNNVQKCPDCGSVSLYYDDQKGEVICNDCGLVVEEKLVDTSQEMQGSFDGEDKKPGTISLNTHLFFVTGFTLFFVRSYTLSKHHSLSLKDAKPVVIFDHLLYMTIISRHPTLLHQSFELKYLLINQ